MRLWPGFGAVLSGLALSLVLLLPTTAQAEDAGIAWKIDLTRINDQPVYPKDAKDRKEEGNAVLAISLDARGHTLKVTVEKSSGFEDLDKIAVTGSDRWYFVPAVEDQKKAPGVARVTVHFQLTPLPKPPVTENDVYVLADEADRITCKRVSAPVGSYITPPPLCLTKQQWDEQAKRQRNKPGLMPGETTRHTPGL